MTPLPVAVTGSTSFVGRELLAALARDAPVIELRRGDHAPSTATSRVMRSDRPAEEVVADLVDARPRAIVHLAAVSGLDIDAGAIDQLVDANLRLLLCGLEAARRLDDCRVITIGSFWQGDTDDAGATCSAYAASKTAAEEFCAAYGRRYGVPSTSLRLADVYGRGDERRRLLTSLADAVRSGSQFSTTEGRQIVSFVHVSDVVAAIRHVIDDDRFSAVGLRRHSIHGPSVGSLRTVLGRVVSVHCPRLDVIWGGRSYRNGEVMEPAFLPWPEGWRPTVDLVDGFSDLLNDD